MGLLKTTSTKFSQTIVMITHNEEIAQLADRIIRIEDGRIVTGKAGEWKRPSADSVRFWMENWMTCRKVIS